MFLWSSLLWFRKFLCWHTLYLDISEEGFFIFFLVYCCFDMMITLNGGSLSRQLYVLAWMRLFYLTYINARKLDIVSVKSFYIFIIYFTYVVCLYQCFLILKSECVRQCRYHAFGIIVSASSLYYLCLPDLLGRPVICIFLDMIFPCSGWIHKISFEVKMATSF